MDYKEKLEEAKILYESANDDQKHILESLFPELPELTQSEDERIRKNLITCISTFKHPLFGERERKEFITWLEKQKGCEYIKKDWLEHIKQSWYKEGFIDGKYNGETSKEWTINDATTLKELIDFLENKTAKLQHDLTQYANWLKIQFVPNEKQGEQKSDNKFETKFKAGDWIVFNGLTLYIKEVVKGFYRTISKNGIPNSYDWDIDNVARLWTIQDARDGDVLAFDNDIIVIFKDFYDAHTFHSYCFIQDRVFDTNEGNVSAWWKAEHFYPATKEQRDTLFKAMADAGYTFDFEKKELKLLITNGGDFETENCEQKPAWSEKDELSCFESALLTAFSDAWQSYLLGEEVNIGQWAKEHSKKLLESAKEELKGHNSAWSGEDSTYYDDICEILINLIHSETAKINKNAVQKDLDWLTSLRQRINND